MVRNLRRERWSDEEGGVLPLFSGWLYSGLSKSRVLLECLKSEGLLDFRGKKCDIGFSACLSKGLNFTVYSDEGVSGTDFKKTLSKSGYVISKKLSVSLLHSRLSCAT